VVKVGTIIAVAVVEMVVTFWAVVRAVRAKRWRMRRNEGTIVGRLLSGSDAV
jgi:hypothetical protein